MWHISSFSSIIVRNCKDAVWTLTARDVDRQGVSGGENCPLRHSCGNKFIHIADDEVKSAEEKFAESLQHAQIGMYHLLENDVSSLALLIPLHSIF